MESATLAGRRRPRQRLALPRHKLRAQTASVPGRATSTLPPPAAEGRASWEFASMNGVVLSLVKICTGESSAIPGRGLVRRPIASASSRPFRCASSPGPTPCWLNGRASRSPVHRCPEPLNQPAYLVALERAENHLASRRKPSRRSPQSCRSVPMC
jgi:hypothetical protein